MDLLHKQYIFANLAARLILYAFQQGYRVTLGDAYRTPAQAEEYAEQGVGIRKSLHCERLAIDLNLFLDDQLLTDSSQYIMLGEFWESLSEPEEGILCTWGGRFNKPDGGHFSIEHNGVR